MDRNIGSQATEFRDPGRRRRDCIARKVPETRRQPYAMNLVSKHNYIQ